jgi:hypothetical protein
MRVQNMTSSRGNSVPNQFIVYTDNGDKIFQSYDSVIAIIPSSGKIQLGRDWAYSNTTGKYRNQFLGENKKDTQFKLDSGIYELNLDL